MKLFTCNEIITCTTSTILLLYDVVITCHLHVITIYKVILLRRRINLVKKRSIIHCVLHTKKKIYT